MHGGVDGSVVDWAERQFGTCDLGDPRRARRAVTIARGMATHAGASIPMQAQSRGDSKAAYRFFDTDCVTFEALSEPHWRLTRQAAGGLARVLVIQDCSTLSFSHRRAIDGLGPIGGGEEFAQGLLLHSALVVTDEPEPAALGLAYQELWARVPAPGGETEHQRHKRPRESQRWSRTVTSIGRLGTCQVLHVCDREADIFELYEACVDNRVGFVVRTHTAGGVRMVLDGHAESPLEAPLTDLMRSTPPSGSTTLELRARPGRAARRVNLQVAVRAVRVPPPRIRDRRRTQGIEPVTAWAVRVWEERPPKGVAPIEWTLLTSEPVRDEAEAIRVIGWYRARWLVEEYHKCLKSGCAVEARQLESAARLKPLTAMLSITAVRLLQLKLAARRTPERPVAEVVPEIYSRVLGLYRGQPSAYRTCRSFWRGVAALGGFLGRKGDGDPGWLTLWRGWQQLELLAIGAQIAAGLKTNCGE